MLSHSLFRILLHLVVYGGIDSEAILVEIILGTVRFPVLVQPAVDDVISPEE